MRIRHQCVGVVLLLVVCILGVVACLPEPSPQPSTATPWVVVITATFTPTVPPTEGPSPTPEPASPTPPPLPPTATRTPAPPPTLTPPPIPQPPVAQIIAPANGTEYLVGQVVNVQFTAGSQSGVSRVALYVGGTRVSYRDYAYRPTLIRNDTLSWTTNAAGNYPVWVVAYDPFGNPGNSDQRNVVVKQQVAAPSVRIDYPTQRVVIQVYQDIQIQATVDGPMGIQRLELVERKDNREVVYTSDANYHNVPYQWRVAWQSGKVGDHRLFVRAWDTSNRMGQSGDFVIGVADDNPPQVQVSYDATTITEGDALKVHVEAVDSTGVSKITLRVDEQTVDRWTAPDPAVGQSYVSVDLVWRNAGPVGKHDTYVRAIDTTDQQMDTRTMPVQVQKGAPPPPDVVAKWEGGQFRLRITEQRANGKLKGTLRVEEFQREAIKQSQIQGRTVTIHATVKGTEYNFILTVSDDGQWLVGNWSTTQTGVLVPVKLKKVKEFS